MSEPNDSLFIFDREVTKLLDNVVIRQLESKDEREVRYLDNHFNVLPSKGIALDLSNEQVEQTNKMWSHNIVLPTMSTKQKQNENNEISTIIVSPCIKLPKDRNDNT